MHNATDDATFAHAVAGTANSPRPSAARSSPMDCGRACGCTARLRDASNAFISETENPLLRACEYTLTTLADSSASQQLMQELQRAERHVVHEETKSIARDIINDVSFPSTNVSQDELQDMLVRLMRNYERVFAAGTSTGYDASIGSDGSNTGSSTRGVWCLYDIQGVDDPDRWIKIKSDDQYSKLVSNMMRLAWTETFSEESNPDIVAMSERIRKKLFKRLTSKRFADKLAHMSEQMHPGKHAKPWRFKTGSSSEATLEIIGKKKAKSIGLGPSTDDKHLVTKLGKHLKQLWETPDTGVKANAERHGEAAAVTVGTEQSHAFSLSPGEPLLKTMLNDRRDFEIVLNEYISKEKDKCREAQNTTRMRSVSDLAEQLRALTGQKMSDQYNVALWNMLLPDTTMRNFYEVMGNNYARQNWTHEQINKLLSNHAMKHLVPPIQAAQLEDKLGKVARALNVPPAHVIAVVKDTKTSLLARGATQVSMIDIKDHMTAAMAARHLDTRMVTQRTVTAALREPQGLVFADTNWGNAENRIKLTLLVNPITGVPEVWEMLSDGTLRHRADTAAKWVPLSKEWLVTN